MALYTFTAVVTPVQAPLERDQTDLAFPATFARTVHSLTDCFRITSKLRNKLLKAPCVSFRHSYLILLVIPCIHCGISTHIRLAARSTRPGPPLGPPRDSWCPSNGPGQSIFCGRSVFLAGGQTRRFTPE